MALARGAWPRSTPHHAHLTQVVLAAWILSTVVSEELPDFLEQPQSRILSQSAPVTLKCVVTPADAQIRWLFDGQPLDGRRHRDLELLGSDLHFLHQAGSDDSNEGEYRCTATTSLGTIISQPAYLSKPALSRFTPADDVTIVVPEDGYATLTCDPPKSSPSARVVFQNANGQLVDTRQETVHQLPSGNLVLSNLTSASAGDFRCVAVNPVSGENRTSPGAISLMVDRTWAGGGSTANIIPGMRQKVHVEIGSDITLECPSYGYQGSKIVWTKYGGSLPVGRFSLSAFGNLKIRSTQYEDSGTYTCSAATNGKTERQVFLEILTPPVVQMLKSPEAPVQVGSPVELACSVAGFPSPELQWFHNGHLLTNGNEGKLLLAAVSAADSGIYQCMATNRLGTAYGVTRLEVVGQPRPSSSSSSLLQSGKGTLLGDDEDAVVSSGVGKLDEQRQQHVRRDRKKSGRRKTGNLRDRKKKKKNGTGGHGGKEKPKYAPTVPTVAQLSDRSVMLNWTVPDKGNGQIIKFFKVQYKEMNPEKGPWRTSDAHLAYNIRRFEVSDLKSGGSYKFRILAVYEDDDNKNSANTPIFKLSVQPHAQARAPDTAPTIVEAKPVVFQQNYGIGVKWQYKAESASPIEGFIIFYKPFGGSEDKEKMIPGAGIRNDVIRDLLPNTPYNIRMQSFNTVGRSQFSNQVVKTTKLRDSSIVEDYPESEIPLKEPEVSTETPVSGRRSTDTLENPVILGVVLGALLLALFVLITMCWWKQRQQKRRSLAGGCQQKFQDQSQCIFADSTHVKPNGTLYPANGTAPIANGHGPHTLEGHKHMNIDVNPLSEYDMQTAFPGDGRTKLYYGNSVNGPNPRFVGENGSAEKKFQHTGSINLHGCNGDIPYMVQQQSLYSMQHCTVPHNSNTFYSEAGSLGLSVNHEYSEPGDRELQSPTLPHPVFKPNIDHHSSSMGPMRNFDYNWSYDQPQTHVGVSHYSSLERLSPLYSSASIDFASKAGICQQYSTHLVPSMPTSPVAHVLVSNFGTVPGCRGPGNPSLHGSGKHKRRRKRPHHGEQACREHAVRDQATNTDLSSNEGTLEFSNCCKSRSCSNSSSEVGGQNCDSSFANNGSLESVNDDSRSSMSAASRESDFHTSADLPASL
ncbi:hypothetical protein BsWGS_28642 [Bradybaena similaris]